MKKTIMLSLGLLLTAFAAQAGNSISFEDQVRTVQEENGEFDVTFHRQAAFYHVPAEKTDLVKLLQNGKDQSFQVTVDSDSLEILSAKAIGH